MKFFSARKPTPVPDNLGTRSSSLPTGDYVIVGTVRDHEGSKTHEKYTTTWFDTWRFVDGKADEHWDCDIKH